VLDARARLRCGPAGIAVTVGVPARTVSRVLARNGIAPLAACDPITGEVIRASRASAVRYERGRPGDLVHVDVKKIGRIPREAGGGSTAAGNAPTASAGWATTSSTPRSTTTAGSPTPRSSTTTPARAARAS